MQQGIDISDAQGRKTVDQFRRLKAEGYDYVIVKTGEGGGSVTQARSFAEGGYPAELSRSFAEDAEWNIRQARRAGLEVGCYHFVHPRADRKGRDEAKIALEAAKQAGWNPKTDKRFAIDFEVTHLSSDEDTRRYALSFIRYIRRHTGLRRPWFYTFTSFWNEHGFHRPMGCRIWQADFTGGTSPPHRMNGLRMFGADRSPIKRWQYTSEGRIPSFHTGHLDLNKGER